MQRINENVYSLSEIVPKINEIIDWINEHDKGNEKLLKLVEKTTILKEEENRFVAETNRMAQRIMKACLPPENSELPTGSKEPTEDLGRLY